MPAASELGDFELTMIVSDCADVARLIMSLQVGEPSHAIGLGLPPFIAWFAGESFRALSRLVGESAASEVTGPLFAEYSDLVTKLRARVKLFDDNRGGLDSLLDTLELAGSLSKDWFNHDHRGVLGRLKRSLQPDLGIFWVDGHPVVTTHSALLTMGLTKERLAALDPASMNTALVEFAQSFSESAGAYVGQLAGTFEAAGHLMRPDVQSLQPIGIEISHSDHHAAQTYSAVQERLGLPTPQHGTAALFVATQVNYIERVLAHLIRPDSILMLRARFLTAYHSTRAIAQLAAISSGDLSSEAIRALKQLVAAEESQHLCSLREVRNHMAHYGLRAGNSTQEFGPNPLEDLTLASCGLSLSQLDALARGQLAKVSGLFHGIAGKDTLSGSRALLGDHT